MEILYARYGGYYYYYYLFYFIFFLLFTNFFIIKYSGNLEREMKLLFGSKLRAEGGDGTLNLES